MSKIYKSIEAEKQAAANKAVDYVQNGMTIGLGTGSTVKFFIEALSEKIQNGLRINAVSTSDQTSKNAKSLGIKVDNFDDVEKIDLAIDGADEVDSNLNGIKGGGGALLYEKIAASNSEKNIWVIDSTKLVNQLGSFPLPVEVVPYGAKHTFKKLQSSGYNPAFRMNGNNYFLSDGNHYIIDLNLSMIDNAVSLNKKLLSIAGIVDTGLFINICDILIVGGKGECKIINKKRPTS